MSLGYANNPIPFTNVLGGYEHKLDELRLDGAPARNSKEG